MAMQTRGVLMRQGFSLVELLVVMLIFAILMSIAVPSLIASQPERNLAAAGDMFANDFNYCRAKAEAAGNNVFLAFEFEPDIRQTEGFWDPTAIEPGQAVDTPTLSGYSYINPGNPGIARVAKAYYIVEERPRFNGDDSPYTYLNWLDDLDKHEFDPTTFKYPVEPMFPYNIEDTYLYATLPDPTEGAFNAIAAPLSAYPQEMRLGTESTTYEERHRVLPAELSATGGWGDGHLNDQQYKIFCIADEAEIRSYDQNPDGAGFNPGNEVARSYDPIAGGIGGNYSGSLGDHPRLRDQVVDYVILKRVVLPEHCYFLNPWKNTWVMGWEDANNDADPDFFEYQDMQFLQYLWMFKPDGEVALSEWGYDPEPFPNGSLGSLNHGVVVERGGVPVARMMWMVLEECIDFGANTAQARASIVDNRKSNLASSGRQFCVWPLNGKYYVSDYTPNDSARVIDYDSWKLQLDRNPGSEETDDMPLVAREFGYGQNFLTPSL